MSYRFEKIQEKEIPIMSKQPPHLPSLSRKEWELLQQVKELEKIYRKEDLFIRFTGFPPHSCFILHQKGSRAYETLHHVKRPRMSTIMSLMDRGLATRCDNAHNEDVDPDNWWGRDKNWMYVGIRIRTDRAIPSPL